MNTSQCEGQEHIEITIYVCAVCKTSFQNNDEVVFHMVESHREHLKMNKVDTKQIFKKRTLEYKCSSCNYKTVYGSTYNRHLLTHYLNGRVHKCPHCSYCSIQRHAMVRHITNLHPNGAPETIIVRNTEARNAKI